MHDYLLHLTEVIRVVPTIFVGVVVVGGGGGGCCDGDGGGGGGGCCDGGGSGGDVPDSITINS